ncbi:hypothetical protein [Anaerobaca lacustris]|uniref:Uncharacterized protein n=1 Tax=Anaerobaca lacustris TaxID=3044600 RepID=A0AAW6U516_9BACT|nr:hypothetical protein [Sedimentisphaerales bacterium M17dextr]
MKRFENINNLVRQVRKRLNRHLGLDLLIRSLCAAGAILLLIGLCYLLRGRRVPLFWYAVVPGGASIAGAVWWVIRRRSFDDAAAYTDRHFQLKDAVRSYEGFSRADQREGIYELQAEHTEAAIEKVRATDVKYRWPVWTVALCVGLLFSSALLTLKADSPKNTEARRQAERVLALTEQINEEIKEALEQIKEDAKADDVEKLIASERLEEMLEELKDTPDLKDAMRQYAALEKELNTMLSKLQQRQDEQLYRKMGQALQESDQDKALGKRLVERQYKEAAEELKKHKIDRTASPEDQRQQLEKLKSTSQRMASEAERNRASCTAADIAKRLAEAVSAASKAMESSSSRPGQQSPTGSQQDSQSAGTPGSSSSGSGSQGSGSSGSGSEGSGSGGDSAGEVNERLDEMAENLNDLDARCKAESLVQSFCKSLSQSQGKLGNQSGDGSGNGQGDGGGDGGLEPGTGSSSNTNANVNDTRSTGDKSVLKGIKGQGPSIHMTEAASDGSGSSSGSNAHLIRQYRHQAESFIRREDVSETVKSGVKEYFERIHHTEEGN